MPRQIPN
jgi:hypothetical protein